MTTIQVGVDVGGTFTDVALAVGDHVTTAKVPTATEQSEGVIAGINKACEQAGIEPAEIERFTHAMTVSTNALLEGTGATTALITTAGFRDVLEIGRQERPDLYDLDVERPAPLVPRRRRYELAERTTVDGVTEPVDPAAVRSIAEQLDDDVESVAVCFLHSYAHPDNETVVAEELREATDLNVSVSHEVLGEFREYERTSTTVVDAYVTPAIDRYLGQLTDRATELGVPNPMIMQSNGGIASAEAVRDRAVTTALSGPAAGVVGAGATAPDTDVITFDMGGTSCDVSLVRDGDAERTTDISIGGYPISVPMVDVNTVGAGGGSIAWIDDGGALRVGPRSAGASPGPPCYGRGGTEPTVTDANVMLGYIGAESALGGELMLDAQAAEDALTDLAAAGDLDGPLAAARGIYRVANANMTRAIRSITVERGHDPREFGLVAFGGAGPLHAAAIADRMDIDHVLVPYTSGVLSAYGLLVAAEKHDAVRTYRTPITDVDPTAIQDTYAEMEAEIRDRSATDDPHIERAADCRYAGQSFELTIDVTDTFDPATVAERFHAQYEATYGYRMDEPIELVNLRLTAVGDRGTVTPTVGGDGDPHIGTREAFFDGEFLETTVYDRTALSADRRIEGPAILEQDESTTLVPPAWTGHVLADGTIKLTRGDTDAQ